MNKKILIDDDELYNTILNRLPYIDEELLLNLKKELIESNDDTKAIDKIIENNKSKFIQEKQINTPNNNKNTSLFDLFNIFKKKNKIHENDEKYEDYQLEEQELEEDDFYYEDVD